ncbi:MAG: NAD-dependent deacylase [Bacteroidetes bacterium]|uniref:protein acetyllysine N-acetyltransferase n=1 Tax=Candidatus Caccoplasma merdipullorum TaxID=2840718 RepID=A0A9D9H8J8_9BACT|nr:NAD-dependent deacylase [Candidatus Caccoplasma merdipullorum]
MKKLVVLTGAGMSAESGLAVFRGSYGMWDKYKIEDVATLDGWYQNPRQVLDFYNQRRRELLNVEPNAGHKGLKELEKYFDVRIITQNVDNLHERAGSSNIIHLHGELMSARSEKDEDIRVKLTSEDCDIHIGDKAPDGAQLRPDIIWFGERVPMMRYAGEWASEADIFVVIGTSLNVYPAAGLLAFIKSGIPVYLIDPNEVTDPYGNVTHYIRKGAGEGVKELITLLTGNK